MIKPVNDGRELRSRQRGRFTSRSKDALVRNAQWQVTVLWTSILLLASCIICFAISLRVAGLLLGLVLPSPAVAAEFSEIFVEMPSALLSRYRDYGSDAVTNRTAAMFVPSVASGPLVVLAADDGSNVGPTNALDMQLPIAAFGGGISAMINYPFGFWCSDNFRVLAGTDASNLNRMCSGITPSGGTVAVHGTAQSGDAPPPLGPCESLKILSQQVSRLSFADTRTLADGFQDNSVPSSAYNGPSFSGFGFVAVSIQQNNGVDVNQQVTLKGAAAFGSRSF